MATKRTSATASPYLSAVMVVAETASRLATDPTADPRDLGTLRAAVDHACVEYATQARRDGLTWQQIGDTLGVTKQAAQQRFGD